MRFRPISYLLVIAALTFAPSAHAAVDINHKSIAPRPTSQNPSLVSTDTAPAASPTPAPTVPAETQTSLDRIAKALETQSAKPPVAVDARPARPIGDSVAAWFGTIGVIGALQAFLLLVGLVVLWKVRVSAEGAARDAKRGADAAERSALAAERMSIESRTIGEAQARAYVGVKLEKVTFDWPDEDTANPLVEISAANTGRSPARDFVWNATLQYIQAGRRHEARLTEGWPQDSGTTVPADETIRDSATLEASLAEFAAGFDEPVEDVVVRVRIAFRYRDVFGHVTEDAAYFIGIAARTTRRPGSAQMRWQGDFYPIPAPADWEETAPPQMEPVAEAAVEPELPLETETSPAVQAAMLDIASAVQQAADDAAPSSPEDAPPSAEVENEPAATTSDDIPSENRRAAE